MEENFGHCARGFRHNEAVSFPNNEAVSFPNEAVSFPNEAVSFINNEDLMNGGGRDFYSTLRSQSWNGIEDGSQVVLTDPQVPRMRQSASAWSMLVALRQRERLVYQVQHLQDQVEEMEEDAYGLASELQRLYMEHENMTSQLHLTRTALEQAVNEHDEVLYEQLLLVTGSIQVALMRLGWFGASAWPLNEEQKRNMEVMGMLGRPWAQNMPPPLPVSVPYSLPFLPPFPPESPFLPPPPPAAEFMEAGGAAMPPNPPPGIYTPNLWASVWAQEEMASLWNHRIPSQDEGPEFLQDTVPLGDIRWLSQEQDLERPQRMVNLSDNRNDSHEDSAVVPQQVAPLWDFWSHSQEQHLERSQGMVTMSDIRNSQEEGPERPQNTVPLEASGKYGQEESSERSQGVVHLGGNQSHCKKGDPQTPQGTVPLGGRGSQIQEEDPQTPQGTVPLGGRGSQSQEGDPQTPQGASLGGKKSLNMRENKKKQQFQGQKAKQAKGIRASKSQCHEMSALCYSGKNWKCKWCGAINLPWRKFCYICRKFCI